MFMVMCAMVSQTKSRIRPTIEIFNGASSYGIPMTNSFAAPWSLPLKLITVTVVVISLFVLPAEKAHHTILLMLALVTCAAFTITNYEIRDGKLFINFPGRSKIWDLTDLQRLEVNPIAMDYSFRLLGTGMFSSVGLYYNSTLGWYRAFATNPKLSVVLYYPKTTVVITPDNPERFSELAQSFINPKKQ